MTIRLRDLGEHGWIDRLLRTWRAGPRTLVGPGDDAAAIRPPRRALLVTTDTLVEGVHFRLGWESPAALGRRALRVNLSDVAAMGGTPLAAVVALEAPPGLPAGDLQALMRALAADARRWRTEVVGGNLAAAPRLVVTLTVLGEAGRRTVTRAGARPHDDVWVTGTLGGASLAVRQLLAARRVRRPPVPVRLTAGRLLAPLVNAMIDVSDGLLQDLGHICRASVVAATVDATSLPVAPTCRHALRSGSRVFAATAGEDYELLFTASPRRRRRLERLAPRLGCRLSRVGRIVAGRPSVRLIGPGGRTLSPGRAGFDHFR